MNQSVFLQLLKVEDTTDMRAFLTISLFSIVYILSAQQIFTDSLGYGSTVDQISYFSFENGTVRTTSYNNWDISFSALGFSSTNIEGALDAVSISINGGHGAEAYLVGSDSEFANTLSPSSVNSWQRLYDNDTSWLAGALISPFSTGSFDFGWGDYNISTHNLEASKTFVIKTVDGNYKKLRIDRLRFAKTFYISYADLDGSNMVTDSLVKTDYNSLLIHYSLDDETVVPVEPAIGTWDLAFGKFQFTEYWQGNNPVTTERAGVRTAQGIYQDTWAGTVGLGNSFDVTLVNGDVSNIGYSWLDTLSRSVVQDISYFVQNQFGCTWQIWMTDWDTTNNKCTFDYLEAQPCNVTSTSIPTEAASLAEIKMYPNPSSGNFILENPGSKEASYEVYTLGGEALVQGTLSANSTNNVQALSNAPTGMYFVKVTTVNSSRVLKLMLNN